MTFFEFIQWCFRDSDSAVMTLIAIYVISKALSRIIASLRSRGDTYHYHYIDNEEESEES